MANEVYQLKVNNATITLGKGPDADDAFISKKEASSMAISAFVSFYIQIRPEDGSDPDPICIFIPGFAHGTSAEDVEKGLDDNNFNSSQLHKGGPILNCSEAGYTGITYDFVGTSTNQGDHGQIAENPDFEIISG